MKADTPMAEVQPKETLVIASGGDRSTVLTLQSMMNEALQYRVKATSSAFGINPSTGFLLKGTTTQVKITMKVAVTDLSRHRIQVFIKSAANPETAIALLRISLDEEFQSLSPRKLRTAASADDLREFTGEENQRLVREVMNLRLEVERWEAKTKHVQRTGEEWKAGVCFLAGVVAAWLLAHAFL